MSTEVTVCVCEVVHGGADIRVIRRENPPTKLQRALLHRQRILMSTEGTVCVCEVIHGGADIRVIRGENPPTKLQRALLHRQRILMSTQVTVCVCEVVHVRSPPCIILAQHTSAYHKRPFLKLDRLVKSPLISQHAAHHKTPLHLPLLIAVALPGSHLSPQLLHHPLLHHPKHHAPQRPEPHAVPDARMDALPVSSPRALAPLHVHTPKHVVIRARITADTVEKPPLLRRGHGDLKSPPALRLLHGNRMQL